MKKNNKLIYFLITVVVLVSLIILLSNVMNVVEVNFFETKIKDVIKNSLNQWETDYMDKIGVNEIVFCRVDKIECENALSVEVDEDINYFIKIDNKGNIIEFGINNGKYQFGSNKSGLKEEDIKVEVISKIKKDNVIEITSDGILLNKEKTIYNKKYLLTSGNESYVVFTSDNTMTLYNSDGSFISKSAIELDGKTLTIKEENDYTGTYNISSNFHEISSENVSDSIVFVEDGYCRHNHLNEYGTSWVKFNINGNTPEFSCYTCGKRVYENNYKIIDGVLYTYNMSVGNGWTFTEVEMDNSNSYSALIWDKNLEKITIKSSVDGIEVKSFTGYQLWTDDSDLKAKTIVLEGFTMDEWKEKYNYWKNNAKGEQRNFLENLETIICSDGKIEYKK